MEAPRPKNKLLTFLVDTGAQISALTKQDATAWGAVPSKGPLLVVNVLGVSQPVTTTAATLMLVGEETTLTATMATGGIPFKFAGAG